MCITDKAVKAIQWRKERLFKKNDAVTTIGYAYAKKHQTLIHSLPYIPKSFRVDHRCTCKVMKLYMYTCMYIHVSILLYMCTYTYIVHAYTCVCPYIHI